MLRGFSIECQWQDILDQLFGLDVGHTVDTGDTITIQNVSSQYTIYNSSVVVLSKLTLVLIVLPAIEIFQARAVTYPTERTRPVSATLASSWTPRILCSRREETSVGEALASAA